MVRRRLALSCAAALCLWLLVLALVPAAGGPQREAAAPAQASTPATGDFPVLYLAGIVGLILICSAGLLMLRKI